MRRYALVLLTLLIAAQSVHAQSKAPQRKLVFKRITLEHGLPASRINVILQTRDGIMWFGTREGFVKYDDGAVTVYQPVRGGAAGLAANDVRAMYEDRSGILWIGMFGSGLYRFDRVSGKLTQYKNNPENMNSLSDDRVLSILEDHNGILWAGTVNGLNTFDRTNLNFSVIRNDPGNPMSLSENRVWPMAEDRDGNIWVGTLGGGINKLEKSTGAIKTFRNDPQSMNSLARNTVMALYTDRSGRLWVGTEEGGLDLFIYGKDEYDRQREEFRHFLQGMSVTSIVEDSAGNIIAGTLNSGIKVLDKATMTVTTAFANDPQDEKSLSDNDIRSLCMDRKKTLWVGTENSGVCVLIYEEVKPKKPRRIY